MHWDIPTWISEEKEVWESSSPRDTRNGLIAKEKECRHVEKTLKCPKTDLTLYGQQVAAEAIEEGSPGLRRDAVVLKFRFTSYLGNTRQLKGDTKSERSGCSGAFQLKSYWIGLTVIWTRTLR